jgi:ABC-2 type transport system permease protein
MFAKIALFEFRYQLKNPVFWVGVILFFLLTFGLTTSDQISIGSNSNVHVNSPYAMAQAQLAFALFFMFVSTAFVANVVVRDDETGYGPIVRATRVRKFDYLFGRFLGAFLAVALGFLAVPLATFIGTLMPWVDPDKIGAFRPLDYAYTYLVIALPGLFLTSAGFFALATATRSMMGTYVGLVAVLVTYTVVTALASKPEYMTAMGYLDPMGFGAVDLVTRYWTVAEKNTLWIPIAGPILWNRALWFAVALALLAVAYVNFRFETRGRKAKKAEKMATEVAAPAQAPTSSPAARAVPRFDRAGARAQLIARTRLDLAQVFKSPAFFVLLALGLCNAGAGLWLIDGGYGVAIYPVTRQMIEVLRGAFAFIPVIVAIYYAGELVWRERDRGTEEIIDAAPVPDWAFVLPKILAIALVFAALLSVSIVAAVLVQALKGYADFEFGKYVWWYLIPLTVSLTLFAVLAVFVQALVPHKFVGWGVMVIYIVAQIVAAAYGLDHGLYRYGGGGLLGPIAPLSDMNGQGRAGEAEWWFRAYWSAIALVLGVLTYALWRRGKETRLTPRLRRLPGRLRGTAGALMAAGVVAALGLGGFIFLNTNIWNAYHTSQDDERWAADYEKALLHYETLPQPKITDVKLNVALYPDHPEAVVNGVYVIQNKTSAPIRELHVRFDHYLKVVGLSVEGARPKQTFERFNYRIFTFDTPMAPGEKRRLSFKTELGQKGFRNSGNMTAIVENGTFLNDMEIAPLLGMDRTMLLTDRAKRRKYRLKPAELRMPKLEDDAARQFNLLRKDADWVNSDITVSTLADQTPIAPGYRVSDVTADGRRTARFVTEAPIMDFFSIQSARYAVRHEPYKGVDLSVYYYPGHPWNVDRMIRALKVGLDYDQANFSPYQFRQVRILEFPAFQGAFAQSFANTIPYSEDIGFIFDSRDKSKIDMVTYVTAHELGHQWWAHQVIGAKMQGVTMLDETLAQYSALMAMEKLYGRDQIRKFLKYELDAYLRSRGGETIEEEPLERVEDQAYIHYRKGSLVMYRLKDVIGEDKVNAALRALLKQYAFKGAPYPKSTDLVALFRQEAGPDPIKQQLITDLFEKITIYDLRTVKAVSKKRADGRYDVTLTLSAKKHYADGKGKETYAPMNEPVDIGLFAKEPGKKGFTAKDVIAMQRMMVKSGTATATVSFVTDRAPAYAGIDPYNTMIDRNSDENLAKVGGWISRPCGPGCP